MISLVADEAMPGLGLSSSIGRPKARLRQKKPLNYLGFFVLKVSLLGSQQVKIHWDIVPLEFLVYRGLENLSGFLQVFSKCIYA